MADGYVDAGVMFRPQANTGAIEEGDSQFVVQCEGCRALIVGGHESRSAHDDFHQALADLFSELQWMRQHWPGS